MSTPPRACNPVHRSQGTVLVGPLDSTVTRSTTLRASESLATFYADLARRELVLVPVRERLGLSMSLEQLRTSVSATVPDENPRVVVVTVEGDSEEAGTLDRLGDRGRAGVAESRAHRCHRSLSS